MKPYCNSSKGIICLAFFIFFIFPLNVSQAKARPAINKKDTVMTHNNELQQFVTINFNDVDIRVFIKFISELTGKNFVIDHRVKGKITIISPKKISIQEAYKVFESVLEVHKYATVKAGKVIKIIPSPDARTKNIETRLKKDGHSPEDRVVTQLIHLKYADPEDIKRLFAPFISKSSVILAYPPTHMLIVTDVYSNIKRLLRILDVIDVMGIGREISVIPLKYANTTDLVNLLGSVFQAARKSPKSTPTKDIKFVADERTNTIVLLASEVDTARINKLITLLDKETPRGQEAIHIYYLENATAEELAKVLQELPKKQSAVARDQKTPVVSEKVRITADKATNSLIIMAEKDDYLVIEKIIKKLDIPRAMVYIESLIMEVNVDKDFRLGTEWVLGDETNINNKPSVYGGGYSGGSGGGDPGFMNLFTGCDSVPLPPGLSLGVFGECLQIGDLLFPNIGAIVQAYKKDQDIHILSTPQILTTDNEEAKINVGKNIPFQTRSAAESGVETYNSFEYRDVGKILKITPHISKDRLVRLNISLEVTVLESTEDFRPTTLKRTIDTTVIVKDGHSVVIGGLIDDSFSETEYKVPCLGDIPGIGWLFRSMANTGAKTNLYVFLTPHVLKTPEEAKELYSQKKSQIEKIEEGQIKMYDRRNDPPESDPKTLKFSN